MPTSLPLPISELIQLLFTGLLYVVAIGFLVYSIAIIFHWFSYGTSRATATTALVIYLVGSLPLLVMMYVTRSFL